MLTSLNGRREFYVAQDTLERVVAYITQNPGKTVIEYANDTLVAESTINLIIEVRMLPFAATGGIAVSYFGRKPDWYHLVPDFNVVPVRKVVRKASRPALRDITDPQLRIDYLGLIGHYDLNARRRSPARRLQERREFIERINYVGGTHQDVIDESCDLADQIAKLRNEMHGMKEAIQVMASALTGTTLKIAA